MKVVKAKGTKKQSAKRRTTPKRSEAEKQAYAAGQGFAAAKAGKRIECTSKKQKASFRAGVKSVKGGK